MSLEDAGSAPSKNGTEARVTLRPPEWVGAKPREARRSSSPPPPLPRREGPPAVECAMRARLEVTRAAGDKAGEREASTRLARWLASRDRGLDEAAALGRRSLELGEDAELRVEVSTWLESLGDAAAAAHVLRPVALTPGLESDEAARTLTRVGVLHARAGDAAASSNAFVRAAATHAGEGQALELLATLSAWAPDVVLQAEAAEAYVEAATRRAAAGALDAQMEDLLRAFDLDPTSGPAVAALASALTDRGKRLAADEAWRAHARALAPTEPKRAATVHARRRLHARAADDVARALGAALDEGLDAQTSGEGGDVIDDLLLRVGLLEPLAARLEIRAEASTGTRRARTLEELARLFAGPLARPDRAAASRVLALAADPTEEDALVALRAEASATRDATQLVEGLVRAIGISPPAKPLSESEPLRVARLGHARALASLAEDQLRDGALAAWAYGAVARFEPGDPSALAGLARNADRWEASRRDIDAQETILAGRPADEPPGAGDARLEPLRALAVLLRSRPDEADRHARVLAELVTRVRGERRWLTEATRLAWRRGDLAEVTRLAEELLARAEGASELVEARTSLALAFRRGGEIHRANEVTIPLLSETPGNRRALAAVWVNAALADDARTRGTAIEQLASGCSPPVRAAMLAVYADTLRDLGEERAARLVAEQACQADPGSARSIATLAGAAAGAHDRTAASALERGINVVFAQSAWCAALADALEEMGDLGYAVGWTQRGVALRPGDRRGIETLLHRIERARDGARLADALSWVLSQPHPTGPLSDVVAEALRELARLDADRAAILARRALDVFGAGRAAMREAMLQVADAVRDDAFAAVVLERALAVDFSADRAALVRMLVRRRAALGDADGEARALARAAREGFAEDDLRERLAGLAFAKLSGDGEIAQLEATAEILVARKDTEAAATAWRELGAMLWDRAGDRAGALRAWLRAAKLVPRGFVTLGMDLARFAGARYALDRLAELVDKEADPGRSGALAAEAARAAFALGEPGRALDLALVAVERNPRLADAIEIAEKGAASSSRTSEMTRLYDAIAAAALGRFGRRAAHYRGARFFEQKNDPGLALKHAAQAFRAVPSEGAPFVLLRRMAERADDRAQALHTIVQIADASPSHAARAGWLLRASAVAGNDEEGTRLRVDVLLQASVLAPDIGTLALLEQAATDLLRIAPEEKESLELRLSRAGERITAKGEGPEGARVAIRFAHMGLELFENDAMGLHAVERAFSADADLDEFASLVPFAARLAHAGDDAEATLARLSAITRGPYANVGLPALELLAAMAAARGDAVAHARLVVLALEKDPSDDGLARRADAAVLATTDPQLLSRLDALAPPDRRAAALRAWAREQSLDGAHEEASHALERALDLASEGDRADIERELVAAYEASGKAEEIEQRALREATNEDAPSAARALRWAEVAQKREARGNLVGAVDALLAAAALDGASIERWSALERTAELAGSEEVKVQAIREIATRVAPDARAAVHKRLARAYEERGDVGAAEATWQAILAADPSDEEADYALEAVITGRGDYSDLAHHLARRVDRLSLMSGTREALRAVRIRRAAILEQRLSRTGDACEELSRVLEESPDNVGALSYLADLQERIGEYARAAPLWKRVAALSREPKAQNEIELRAARAAMAAKDYASALVSAREVLSRESGQRDALVLQVEAARAMRGDRDLGDALEELALSGGDEGIARSDLWLEASAAASRVGDWQAALARAQYAARSAPGYPRAQLLARTLEYRARGAGTAEDSRRTVADLSGALGTMTKDEAAVHAFLTAEALDVFEDGGAGLAWLVSREVEIGDHPWIALGIAERKIAAFDFAGALPYFQSALLGDLSDLRERGRVALAGADAAIHTGENEVAIRLLEEAAIEGPTRVPALLRAAHIASSRGEVAKARNILTDLADSVEGEDRARALAQLSELDEPKKPPAEAGAGEDAPPPGALQEPPPNAVESATEGGPGDLHAIEHAVLVAPTRAERIEARLALARAHLARGSAGEAELCLYEDLAQGEMSAGEMLASLFEAAPERTSELVRVRQQLVELEPGAMARLEDLRRAAVADKNLVYARALEHVARSFDPGAGPLPPPALGAQSEQPGLLALLTRASSDRVAQALACVWEEAPGLFASDSAELALQGAERVQADGASPIARLYEAAVRLLGIRPTPLYVRRDDEPLYARAVLTSPASALLLGCPSDDGFEVRFALGQALASALPTAVLAVAPEPDEARGIWEAIVAAFGPTDAGHTMTIGKAHLAEALWQALPARTQRRLQSMLTSVRPDDLEQAKERVRQAARRIGLFLGGDFGFAARLLLNEEMAGADGGPPTLVGQSLQQICAVHPAVLDLFRLAVSPEYADARWRPGSPSSHNRLRVASGRFGGV